MKAAFDDRVITVRTVSLESGETIPAGTHGFVFEAFDSPESYDVEFDLETGQIPATVLADDVGAGELTHTPGVRATEPESADRLPRKGGFDLDHRIEKSEGRLEAKLRSVSYDVTP